MSFTLTQNIADQLDTAIGRAYPTLGGGELTQLAKLFSGRHLLTELISVLQPAVRQPNVSVTVQLAWIDKRPYALMDGEAHKVEIADAAFFSVDTVLTNKGGQHDARCLLLQAKAPSTKTQLNAPRVCLQPAKPKPDSTTGREFRLLSSWPKFDLFLGSNSSFPMASALTFPPSQTTPPMGWFIGSPFVQPSTAQMKAWPSPWMCAPAIQGHACDETLGSLLARHLSGGQSALMTTRPVDAGASFIYQPNDLAATIPHCVGWDRLCIELIRAARNQIVPPHLTHFVTTPGLQQNVVYSLPVWPALRFLTSHILEFYQRLRRRRMPILIVSRTFDERRDKTTKFD